MTKTAQLDKYNTLFIYGLFAIALVSIVAYVCLTIATIFATSHRSSAVHQAATLTSQIGELEQSYLLLQNRVNRDQATVLGLVTPHDITEVSEETLSLRN